ADLGGGAGEVEHGVAPRFHVACEQRRGEAPLRGAGDARVIATALGRGEFGAVVGHAPRIDLVAAEAELRGALDELAPGGFDRLEVVAAGAREAGEAAPGSIDEAHARVPVR